MTRAFQDSMGIIPFSPSPPIDNGGYAGKAMVSLKDGKLAVIEENGTGTMGVGTVATGASNKEELDTGWMLVFDKDSSRLSFGWASNSIN